MTETVAAKIALSESERLCNEAEKQKLERETELLEKQLSQKWYSGRFIVQAVVGGAVAAGLLAVWAIGYIQPIVKKENELASIENKVAKMQIELERIEARRRTDALAKDAEAAKKTITDLVRQNSIFKNQLEEETKRVLALQGRLLAQANLLDGLGEATDLSNDKQVEIARLASETREDVKELERRLRAVQDTKAQVEKRGRQLEQSLTITELRDSSWRVQCIDCDSPYYMHLRTDGVVGYNFSMPRDYNYSSFPATWQVFEGVLSVVWDHGEQQTFSITGPSREEYLGAEKDGTQTKIIRVSSVKIEGGGSAAPIKKMHPTTEGGG